MIRKGLILIAAMLMLPLTLQPAHGQTSGTHPANAKAESPAAHTTAANAPATRSPSTSTASGAEPNDAGQASSATTSGTGASGTIAKNDCLTGPCDYQPPRITVANPPAIIAPWLMRDKISWAASLVLVLLGYVGIMLAISVLKKIERQTRAAETAAEAARTSADAALMQAQALRRAERPWVMVTVESEIGRESGFIVVAVNRGRSAARIEAAKDQAILAADEQGLPAAPAFPNEEQRPRREPAILLPGESIELKRFGREDVTALCSSEEQLTAIEKWEKKIYLYGNVQYTDLTAVEGEPGHETGWCFWYIHGRQKSGLIVAGPDAYRAHT